MGKRALSVIVIMLIVFNGLFSAMALESNRAVAVIYESEEIAFNSQYGYPYIVDDRVMVPMRIIFENMGIEIEWNSNTRVATAKKSGITIEFPLNKVYMYKNGIKMTTYVPTEVVNGRIYVSLRTIADALHMDVKWDSFARKVFINNKTYQSDQFDLRQLGKVTDVKNQYAFGTCWAFAAMGALESTLAPRAMYDFSEDNLALGHGLNVELNEGGDHYMAIAYFARWAGPVLEKEDPYGDNAFNKNATASVHVQEVQFIAEKDFSDIKRALTRNGAVQTSIYFTYDALKVKSTTQFYNKSNFAYNYTGNEEVNHDILIVGWDDNYPKEKFTIKPEADGAFICKNSYGTGFGDKGYFYVSYYDKRVGKNNVVYTRVESKTNYQNIYQYDKLGWNTNLGFYSDTAYMSSVYKTGSKSEVLKAVAFYALGPNTSYTVYLVPKFNSESDLNSRIKLKEGSFTRAGYYTVRLTDNEVLSANTNFAIVVKITTPNSKYPIVGEGVTVGESWGDTIDISDGISYISATGKNWERAEETQNTNVSLKVFTNNN